MNDRRDEDERKAMIAGGRAEPLPGDAAEELQLLADLLADPSTWAAPRAGLEADVVHAVVSTPAAGAPAPGARPRRLRASIAASMAAASVAVVLAVGIVASGSGAGPDYVAALHATALAPGARASADITRNAAGFHVTLDAHGLAPLGPGEYYQAWLKNAAGTGVPIGTFSSSDGRVTLWSGVSPDAFPTMTVTIEATDGDQASSGRVVLVGPARRG